VKQDEAQIAAAKAYRMSQEVLGSTLATAVSIDDAIQCAVIAESDRVVFSNANFKVHPVKKDAAELILRRRGTTLSAFYRACTDQLIQAYAGPKVLKKLSDMRIMEAEAPPAAANGSAG
jgi:hypothetical protein